MSDAERGSGGAHCPTPTQLRRRVRGLLHWLALAEAGTLHRKTRFPKYCVLDFVSCCLAVMGCQHLDRHVDPLKSMYFIDQFFVTQIRKHRGGGGSRGRKDPSRAPRGLWTTSPFALHAAKSRRIRKWTSGTVGCVWVSGCFVNMTVTVLKKVLKKGTSNISKKFE